MNIGMVFIIIFSIVVIMMFFIFGFDSLQGMMCLGNEATTTKAIKDLESMVIDTSLQGESSSNIFKLRISEDSRFCFIDPENADVKTITWNADRIAIGHIRENNFNLWYDHCTGTSGFTFDKLKSVENFCVKSADLYLENKGFFVSIEKV